MEFPIGNSNLAREAANPTLLKQAFDAYVGNRLKSGSLRMQTMDAAVSAGLAFLESELEKRDPKVREPLTSVTWMRDIPVKSGGGWVDFTSNLFVDYGISGPNGYGIQGSQTTTIPIVQANLTKDVYRTYNWGNV